MHLFLHLIAFCITLSIALGLPGFARAGSFLFENGHLITMIEGQPGIQRLDLLVTDDRIVRLGTSLTEPEDAETIDLNGGYLMPGLAEMHAHVPAEAGTYRDDVLFLYLANGVTTIRGMLGAPAHLKLRHSIEAGEVLGPRLITSGPSFNGRSINGADEASARVRSQVEAGYDFLKIHPGLDLAEYDAMAETARVLGIPFAGHVPAAVGVEHALASGQATIDHLDGYVQALVPGRDNADGGLVPLGLLSQVDANRIPGIIQATLDAGAAMVPTETLLENFTATDLDAVVARQQNDYLPPDLLARYRRSLADRGDDLDPAVAAEFLALRKRLIHDMHQAGVLLLLGSDAPQIFNVPGFSLHRELASMTAAGLSPHEALVTGTRNPASYFEATGEFGTLENGAAADLIWVDANPLEDIGNSRRIQGVMVRGRWFDRDALDSGLAEIRERN